MLSLHYGLFHDVFVKTSETKLDLRTYSMKLPIIMKITRIGLPAMINYMLIYFGFFLINKEMEKYGAIASDRTGNCGKHQFTLL